MCIMNKYVDAKVFTNILNSYTRIRVRVPAIDTKIFYQLQSDKYSQMKLMLRLLPR